jgi:hypothetical protein
LQKHTIMEKKSEKQREGMTFYRSFYRALGGLPIDESRLALYDAIFKYAFENEMPEFDEGSIELSFWMLIEPILKASQQRFINGSKAKSKRNESESEAEAKQNASKSKSKSKSNKITRVDEFIKRKDEVISEIKKEYPNSNVELCHQDIVDYCTTKGATYKDYIQAMRVWLRRDKFSTYGGANNSCIKYTEL